jgi:hypothetical protein
LVRKAERKKTFGTARHTWENNMRKDIR